MRPGVYACVACIRRFRAIGGMRIPAVFGFVLLGLLHGCCTCDPGARCQSDECTLLADGLYPPICSNNGGGHPSSEWVIFEASVANFGERHFHALLRCIALLERASSSRAVAGSAVAGSGRGGPGQ